MTFATVLTLSRLILVVPASLLALDNKNNFAALLIFVFAAMTDYFDGLMARRFMQVTTFGARLDASVDKIFIYAMLAALLSRGTFVVAIVAVAFGRDVIVEVLRQRAAAARHVIPANRWGKSKFSLQCLSVGIALLAPSLPNEAAWRVLANVVLALAVVASVPGVVIVWSAAWQPSRGLTTR